MNKFTIVAAAFGFVHCMGVEVPEEYISDKYYASPTQVVSVSPSTSMSWTTLSQSLQIKFNNPMDAASLTVDTAGDCVTGNIRLRNNRDNFCPALTLKLLDKRNSILVATPSADLDPNTSYTITVAGAVTDFRGTAFGSDQTFPFTTGIPSGQELRVVSVTAAAGSFAGDAVDITIIFSRALTNAGGAIKDDCNQVITLINPNTGNCYATVEYPSLLSLDTSGAPTYRMQ